MPIHIHIGQLNPALTHKGQRPLILHHTVAPVNCASNTRKPSLITWEWFVRRHGLNDLFFGPEGLMRLTPGCVAINRSHANAIRSALRRFEIANPQLVDDQEADIDPSTLDYERLRWLNYWFEWALDHCNFPAIWNSPTTD